MTNSTKPRADAAAPSLTGQIVLVTGASGGIGAAIVERLVREGARPLIHYCRNESAALALLERTGGDGWVLPGNLADERGPAELWRRAIALSGRIDALVNNAGIRKEVEIDAEAELWLQAWREEFQVNFFAAADLAREAIQHFRGQGGGRIVNIASRAGQRGYAANAMAYGASKAALLNLTKSIARSFAKDGITSVAIAPGWVRTDMAEEFVATHGESAATGDIPIGAMASPDEVAELVAFALRPSQRSLNGATLDVNGGSYVR